MHSNHNDSRRSSRPDKYVLIGVLLASAIIASCSPAPGPGPGPAPAPEGVRLIPGGVSEKIVQLPDSEFAHDLIPAIDSLCRRLQWTTCRLPEFTDDQSLMDSDATYGPHAFIAPAEDLGQQLNNSGFSRPKLVAFVWVDRGNLPQTYRDLSLRTGFTCVYLVNAGGAWRAIVTGLANNTCPADPPAGGTGLVALGSPLPAGLTDPNQMPPVARFHEGTVGSSTGNPQLGIRCGDQWCRILPASAVGVVDTVDLPHKAVKAVRTWQLHGWNDVQHVALPPIISPGSPIRSRMLVSFVGEPALDAAQRGGWSGDMRHVATVFFHQKPQGRYESVWKFREGENEIWMKKVGNNEVFEAELRQWVTVAGVRTLVYNQRLGVVRWDHGRPVPGTVRFLWSLRDEDLWVSCDDGCCKVSPPL